MLLVAVPLSARQAANGTRFGKGGPMVEGVCQRSLGMALKSRVSEPPGRQPEITPSV